MEEIKQLITEKMLDWKGVEAKDILLERMTGLTN
jgi:hypothetical protein